jgi:hypothetical protein
MGAITGQPYRQRAETGCYLLPILSNLQAPIFKCLEMIA